MNPALHRQRGAGTLMATVFLLLIVALLGGIGLRMASTDINDTALQNDSVEALFLAESGLERALQKLAAGTACGAAVIDAAAQTLGRGTFQITSAALNAGLCRVRVLGSVGLAGATPATRLIEADLSLGGCRGFAVGDTTGGNEVILCWNGTSWTRSGPYAAIPNTTLNSVSCAAANDCWAVGNQSGGELIARWNGTTWTRWPISAIPNQNLLDVHCVDSNNCWAVGNNRTFARWNGVTWSTGATAGGFPNVAINSVYCVAANNCWAVGNASAGNEVIARWTGGPTWARMATTAAVPDVTLLGVTCASTNDCWAVGNTSVGSEVTVRWTGGPTWTRVGPTAAVPDQILRSVSCVSGTDCWATGDPRTGGPAAQRGEVLARWVGGPDWSRPGPYGGVANVTLFGIHMVSGSEGYSVGNTGTIAAWNGSIWNSQVSPVTSRLLAVAIAPAGGGTVAVQRWREIIQ